MKINRRVILFLILSFFLIPIWVYGQFGNSISGYVFGLQRNPVSDVAVEVLDDFSRTIARTRTNASGYYNFNRIPAGRFKVRVLPYEYDYEQQEQEVEIVNFTRDTSAGVIVSGFDKVQRDFYLRQRRNNQSLRGSGAIFIQEVPDQAKVIYKRAVEFLSNKKELEGLKYLKSAIEIFPDYYDAIERLGMEYTRLGYNEAAQILLSRAVEINFRGFNSWYGLAYSLYSQNKLSEAVKASEKALSLNQSSVDMLLLDAAIYKRLKNYKYSEKQLKKAKEFAKDSVPEVHWQLALLYGNNLSRYQEAADELEIYLKMQPNNANAENIRKLIVIFREKAKNNN